MCATYYHPGIWRMDWRSTVVCFRKTCIRQLAWDPAWEQKTVTRRSEHGSSISMEERCCCRSKARPNDEVWSPRLLQQERCEPAMTLHAHRSILRSCHPIRLGPPSGHHPSSIPPTTSFHFIARRTARTGCRLSADFWHVSVSALLILPGSGGIPLSHSHVLRGPAQAHPRIPTQQRRSCYISASHSSSLRTDGRST